MTTPIGLRRWGPALVAAAFAITVVGHAQAIQAADPDPWFGPDKVLHFEAAGSLAVVGYAGTSMLTTQRSTRAGVGEALGVGAGIAKELWDLDGHGDASWRDLTWDFIGATSGVLIAFAVDWTVHRVFNWPVGRQSR